MSGKPQASRDMPDDGAADFWPLLVEFALSLKSWWVSLCDELELTPAQGHALRALDPDRPVAMSTLADSLFCDASNVTGIVDKLETRGLIARQGSEHDRRIKMLVVTESGRDLREKLMGRAKEPPPTMTGVPAETRCQLATALRAILAVRGEPRFFR